MMVRDVFALISVYWVQERTAAWMCFINTPCYCDKKEKVSVV